MTGMNSEMEVCGVIPRIQQIMPMKAQKITVSFLLVVCILLVCGFLNPVAAKTITKEALQTDKDYWDVNNSTYTLYCFAPPVRYGKEFGKASDYTYKKKKATIFRYVSKEPSKMKRRAVAAYKLIRGLYKVYQCKHFIGYSAFVTYYTKDIKGIKIEQTTYYNKHTRSYTVGKNKKCKRDVFKIYYMKKGSSKWKCFQRLDDRYTTKIYLK